MSSSLWSGFLKKDLKPSVINPKVGFLVTANQNIFGHNAGAEVDFGKIGAPPFRALRIKEHIEEALKKDGKVSFNELACIQLDDTSLEAKALAPLLGARCKAHFFDSKKQAFADAVANFDGHYSIDSRGALPYELLVSELVSLSLRSALGQKLPDAITYTGQVSYGIKRALLHQLQNEKTVFYSLPISGFKDFFELIDKACDNGYKKLVKKGRPKPSVLALWTPSLSRTPKPYRISSPNWGLVS